MRYIIFFYIFLVSNILSSPLIPIWNLEKSSINLLPSNQDSNSIELYKNSIGDMSVNLYKELKRDTSNNKINEQNYIQVINENPVETNWEDIESFYHIKNKGHFVCPKGSEYLNQYSNNIFIPIVPDNFEGTNSQWELLCYQQGTREFMFQSFFNIENKINFFGKYYNINNPTGWLNQGNIGDAMYDFIWSWNSYTETRNYNMYALILIGSSIYLQNIIVTIENGSYDGNTYNFYISYENKKLIDNKSTYTRTYFDHDTNLFYWMSANGIDSFSSGYSTEGVDVTNSNVNIAINKNSTSPFKFLGSYNIKQLDLIRNTRFVYYQIENSENEDESYSGIIDIKLNQIVFNTNIKFTKFKPLKHNSIIAFTETDVYQICAIKQDNVCVDECTSGTLVLDPMNGNYCGTKNCDLALIPEGICIDSCNTSIFTLNDDKSQCGLCKDIYPDNKPYKLFGEEGCLSEKTHKYLLYPRYNILDECPITCKECENLNKCTSCYKGYKLSEGQCVQDEEKEEEEKEEEEKEEEKEKEEEEEEWDYEDNTNETSKDTDYPERKAKYMLWIFIIIIFIILLILSLCICKRNCARNKTDGEIINNINTELREDNNIIE